MAQVGIGSIEAEEGMAALEGFNRFRDRSVGLDQGRFTTKFSKASGVSDAFAYNPQAETNGSCCRFERDAAFRQKQRLATMIVPDAESQ